VFLNYSFIVLFSRLIVIAIGLTGSILGGVFNTLAVTMTDGMNIVARAICIRPIANKRMYDNVSPSNPEAILYVFQSPVPKFKNSVFNTLAVTMTDGMNIVARAICMLLILLVGHSIIS